MTRTKSRLSIQRPKRRLKRKQSPLPNEYKLPSPLYGWKKKITRAKLCKSVSSPENTNRNLKFQSRIPHCSGKRQLSKTPIKSPFRSPLYKASPVHKIIKRISSRRLFNETKVCFHNEIQVDNIITISSKCMDSQSDTDTASETQDDHSNKKTIQTNNSIKSTSIYMDSESDTEAQDDNANKTTNRRSKESEQAIHIENNEAQLDSAIELNKSRTIEEITNLLPDVMNELSENGGLDQSLLTFFRQVKEKKFPLTNVAFLLWLEVVQWFENASTTNMRYSDQTKLLWKLGWRMFGGRFLHFMGGYKSQTKPCVITRIQFHYIFESFYMNLMWN